MSTSPMKKEHEDEVLKIQEDVSKQVVDHRNRKWPMPDRKSEMQDLLLHLETVTGPDHPTEYLQI